MEIVVSDSTRKNRDRGAYASETDEQRLLRFAKLLVRPSIGSEAIAAD
jgi:hypothetical protein